ncbi:peptidylprolyl isomerase [Paucibacter soli]|uniref:peptidylprolyl isomerase n=1 Tax=Paucibacter soli TaxID=3133433 RepID=UPI0030A18694
MKTATTAGAWWRLCAEPLVQFLLAGALLFASHAWLQAWRDPQAIVMGEQDLERLRAMARKQWGREPDAAQLDALLQAQLREEVLYREALAQGLDRDDVVIRRRLAQKMEFLAQGDAPQPDDAQLRAWYDAHLQRYDDATRWTLEQRAVEGRVAGPARLDQADAARITAELGAEVAARVATLAPDTWSEAIASPLGRHSVRVLAVQPPSFEALHEQLRLDWVEARQREARDAAYARLRERYRITLPPPSPQQMAGF